MCDRGLSLKYHAIAASVLLAQFSAPVLAQAVQPTGATAKQWPVEAFAELPFMDDPELSPDGMHIAAKAAIKGEQILVVIDVLGGDKGVRPMKMGENDLNWWSWVNNDWLITGLGAESHLPGGNPVYISRVASVSQDMSKMNLIARYSAAQSADDVIWKARDGSPRILLSYQTSIYLNEAGFWPQVDEVNVATGKMRKVVPPHADIMSWRADALGQVRMGVGYNDANRMWKLLYRPDGKSIFKVVDRASRRRDEKMVVPLLFTADPDKAIASDDHEGAEALYEFDLKTLQLGQKIFSVPGFDLGSAVANEGETGLKGVYYTADAPVAHWFDPTLAQIQSDIDKAVGNRRARIVSISRDNKRMIVHVGNADQPGAFYYYNIDVGTMKLLADVSNSFRSGTRLSPVKTVRYKARDGLEIAAVLTVPAGKEAKALPLILMPHGGPSARDSEQWDWQAQFLANRGYAVLQPNYRGSSGYGTAFAEKGEGQWGLAMQDDLNDAVDWAVKEGIADAKRVCMMGSSYGGYAAMRAAQRDGSRYRCAISYAGVSDLGAMTRYDRRFLNSGTRKDWLKEQAPDFAAVSPINFAAQFSTPILLVHGRKDRRVPVTQSRDMADKLKAAGRSYVYVEQPQADHHFSRQADRLDFLQQVEAFLKQHNPA